jgi:pyruvate dehydrogenase E1 component alpha subunit
MNISYGQLTSIYQRMIKIRGFELRVRDAHINGRIGIPIYLGVGQESIAATTREVFPNRLPIFAQHRSHSYYIAFGGKLSILRDELLSKEEIWDRGAGGSASISDKSIPMYGHSGFMGDQIPIAAGFAMMKQEVVLGVIGDASAEEDYVLATLGLIEKKQIPLLLICEDNNLSILTTINTRRNWKIVDVARSFGCEAYEISDHPIEIFEKLSCWNRKGPLILNIKTNRHLWHAGSGQDHAPTFDTLQMVEKELMIKGYQDLVCKIKDEIDIEMDLLWK